MRIPDNMSEAEVLATINKVVDRISYKYRFGFFDENDVRQQGVVLCIEALEKYDGVRRLENFLAAHLKNRFLNLRRDLYIRYQPTCKPCHETGRHSETAEGTCKNYRNWCKRNITKQSLMNPMVLDCVSTILDYEDDVSNNIIIKDAYYMIDKHLPIEYRANWLRMRDGISVPKLKRDVIVKAINEILKHG